MNDPRRLEVLAGRSGTSPAPGAGLRAAFERTRARTAALAQPLSDEDCCVQSMPDASPVKWHLAHTTWFFETFLLEKFEPGFKPFSAAFRVLFNSYYNGVGEKHPRPQRGMLTRPPLRDVLRYRDDVNGRMLALFDRHAQNRDFLALVELGVHHEQQHDELILTDVKHLLSLNPQKPAYQSRATEPSPSAPDLQWIGFDGGLAETGYDGNGFCFDNELPRHPAYLQPYSLAKRLVTNGEFLQFIEAGGYRNPGHWLSEGWDWVRANGLEHPLYWSHGADGWSEFTLGGSLALDPHRPAVHLSYFEADAYARWAGARLPTEAEWEHAAASCPVEGNLAYSGSLHPRAAAAGSGLQQLFGDAWEWTQSSYSPYPGFRAAEGAIGEYNGKFMVNQYVLRGGSCATPDDHIRASYRNFFPATARWQFSGVRLARDGSATLLG